MAPYDIPFDPELVIRQSCGCFSQTAREATVAPGSALPEVQQKQGHIVAEMVTAVDPQIVGHLPGWADNLFEAALTDLAGKRDHRANCT